MVPSLLPWTVTGVLQVPPEVRAHVLPDGNEIIPVPPDWEKVTVPPVPVNPMIAALQVVVAPTPMLGSAQVRATALPVL